LLPELAIDYVSKNKITIAFQNEMVFFIAFDEIINKSAIFIRFKEGSELK